MKLLFVILLNPYLIFLCKQINSVLFVLLCTIDLTFEKTISIGLNSEQYGTLYNILLLTV